ncbi:MAG: SpoIID/LytB domain-containing protein [Holophagaceae bacterium]|nr:SpoIID/LytB domain-containing protein [Holophagaceae bacterium]
MNPRVLSTSLLLAGLVHPVSAQAPVRIGLSTEMSDWQVTLDGGGDLVTRGGRLVMKLRDGEKLRIWWDSRGEADPRDEYRIRVGGDMSAAAAAETMRRLRELGEQPEKIFVPDGASWKVLTGHFSRAEDTEQILQKLSGNGFPELWVSSEHLPGKPRKGRALYAVTERYERRPLPSEGVLFRSNNGTVHVLGKGRYRGTVEFFPNGDGRLTVVNQVALEDYVRGVVPREMGANEYPNVEALKVQAVAARTYVVANRGKRKGAGFDLLDTPLDQVYGGKDGEQPLADRAVAETAGLIATYGGAPIQALFTADSGGATVDNSYVFGGPQPYLKGVSNYPDKPMAIAFLGAVDPGADQSWLNLELLRLAAFGIILPDVLTSERMEQPLRSGDLTEPMARLCQRLGLPAPERPVAGDLQLYLWMAKTLGFDRVVDGMERSQDADYFVGPAVTRPGDRPLAAFLARRGIVSTAMWHGRPTLRDGLTALSRMWQELEAPELAEGTLLRDGTVRRKLPGAVPEPLPLASFLFLAEESIGGQLRLVSEARIQVGDRVKWMPREGGSRLLIRRLDPDGAAWDRYNPAAHWKVELKDSDLLAKVKSRVGVSGIRALELDHNEHGRVLKLTVRDTRGVGHEFTGMRIRALLGLRDNVFRYITVGTGDKKRWIFYGRGWGHAVGMDQTGAYGMALEGYTYDQILKRYYRGIEITAIQP